MHYHGWKYTNRIIPLAYFQQDFFCAHFPSVKLSIFFTERISNRISNYRRTLFRWTYSIGELVDKIFTDGMVILCRRKNSIDKIVKCCSDVTLCFLDFEKKKTLYLERFRIN